MDLKVRPARNYAYGFPQYNLPLEIGCYSINSDGKYCGDGHQMKYLAMPDRLTNLSLDLNEGYDDYIDIYEDTEDTFDAILRWIVSHEDLLRKHFSDSSLSNSKIDFVFYRGFLKAVCSTMYKTNEDWKIYATKFRSVIYMAVIKTDASCELKERIEERMGEKGERLSTWGFKFEQYMTADTINSRPDTSVPVNENEKYYSVMKGKLDNHKFLFAAEMDGVDPEHFTTHGHNPKSTLRYIELKTSRVITSEKQRRNFLKYKLVEWYLQSYFAGVPRVICGHRDDDGIVRMLVNYNVRDMPKMAQGLWSSRCCLNFCSHFLSHVKNCEMKDDPRVVYEFYWEPGSDIIVEEKDSEYQLLPDWYIDRVKVI